MLRVGPITGHHVCSVTTEGSNGDIIRQYPEIFQGVGKLKNYQESLHIDDSVKPAAQPVWRLPFGLQEKVDSKLDELLREDIIEVISVPTKWVSSVVSVPKSKIRTLDFVLTLEKLTRQSYQKDTMFLRLKKF